MTDAIEKAFDEVITLIELMDIPEANGPSADIDIMWVPKDIYNLIVSSTSGLGVELNGYKHLASKTNPNFEFWVSLKSPFHKESVWLIKHLPQNTEIRWGRLEWFLRSKDD